jgi:hypothetical protein
VTAESSVIYHIARLIAHQRRVGRILKFITDKTGKKRLSRHIHISSR